MLKAIKQVAVTCLASQRLLSMDRTTHDLERTKDTRDYFPLFRGKPQYADGQNGQEET
jgi:hypothetical protein